MSVFCFEPYAAKAIIEHDWIPDTLDIFLTFRHPMDQSVKPPHANWLLTINGVPTLPQASAWRDAFTLVLSHLKTPALPTTVEVEYDGPLSDLKTTWGKQWEPWGDIVSTYLRSNRGRTADGGFATQYINKTGAPSVRGNVLCPDPANADSVILTPPNCLNPIAIFVDSGIADGSLAWCAIAGRAKVWMDGGGCVKADRIITSAVAGRGDVNNLPAVAAHFQEIGHSLEDTGANGLAFCDLHFL